MSPRKLGALLLIVLGVVAGVQARIGVEYQLQLGNPSNATSDSTNHDHYLIERDQYVMDYSDINGEPNWVSWDLTTDDLGGSGRSQFIPDTTLPNGFYQVQITDYQGSGYDRGHMCPSADRTITVADNQVLFYMSNMIPQAPDNNQGVWASFENYCRSVASAGNELLITCGPSFFGGSRVPSGAAAIPGYTWKIVVVVPLGAGSALERINADTRVIAIRIPNIAGVRNDPWQNYVTSTAQIENDTGFNFFSTLPPTLAAVLKAKIDGQPSTGMPVIVSQPSSQTTVVGGFASFSVSATGNDPLSYQWFKDEVLIPRAVLPSLALSNIQAEDAGAYECVVTNPVGTATSASASLIISGLPPTIVSAPASQSVNAGTNVTFAVTASGSPTLTYQWYKNNELLAGANRSTLTLGNVQAADSASYTVAVANSVGTAMSEPASLTVVASAPVITVQPSSHSATSGGQTGFSVTASGTAPLSYQWRKDGAPLANGLSITGADTASLVLANLTVLNAGTYDVVVTNPVGQSISNAASLVVTPPAASAVTWTFGSSAGASADPSSGLTPDISGGTLAQGNNNGTTALLTTTSASGSYSGASGSYNAGAAARTGALITATGGSAYFEFTLTPAAGKRLYATALSFGSRSTGTGPQAYAVFTSVNNFAEPVATGTLLSNSSWSLVSPGIGSITGQTGTPVTFRIFGYNGAGNASASTANWRIDDLKLTVSALYPPPVAPQVVATSPANGTNAVAVGSPITVTFNEAVSFTGNWFSLSSARNGSIAATVTGGPVTYTLTPPASFANTDVITVQIFNDKVVDQASASLAGSGVTTISFDTEDYVPPTPPSITAQPASQTVNVGSNVSFTVAASGTAPLTFQWLKGSSPIGSGATLSLSNVTTDDAGAYRCIVSNVAGSDVSSTASLTVNVVPPSIASQPSSQVAVIGTSATFSVAASGTAPLTYQWRHDGLAIPGANAPSFSLSSVTALDTGRYDVVVTNGAGLATSASALLAVTPTAPATAVWDFTVATPISGLPDGVTGGTVTQGNNNGTTPLLTTTSASSGYAGATGTYNAGAAARTGALNQGATGSAYFEFTLTPPAGKQLAVTGLSFGARSTGTGPQAYAIFSSVDNFAAPLASGTLVNNSSWALISPIFAGVTSATGAPVTLRIYGFNGTGSPSANTANWRLDDLKVTAALLAIPATVPTITSVSPETGSTGVARDAAITIAFDQDVITSTDWFVLSSASHGELAASASGGPGIYTLTPAEPFDYGDTISVLVRHDKITEAATGTLQLASDYSFSFATVPPVPPTITTNPSAASVSAFETVTLSVDASGTGPLTYQWRHDGAPVTENASASTAALTLERVTVADAGNYDCVVTNRAGTATSELAELTVVPVPTTITLSQLSAVYDGLPHVVSAATNPAGVPVSVTYNGSSIAPVGAGTYLVAASVSDPNYAGSASGTLVIAKAQTVVTLGDLHRAYDGTAKVVSVETAPSGLPSSVTYDGATQAPTLPGSYAVVATVDDDNFTGSATGTLTISVTATVRHGFQLNGEVDGSVQLLLPESVTLNSSAGIFGDLLSPGTPAVRRNGTGTFGGVIDAAGIANPTTATVTLNGATLLNHLVRRVNALVMPVVAAPLAPAGTRSVSINSATQSPGAFATLRDLTVNASGVTIAVPAGNYGKFTINSTSTLVLGTPGTTEPSVYNLQALQLNSGSRIAVVGPVILTVGNTVTLNTAVVGDAAHPEWLVLQIPSGSLTLNGDSTASASVVAPNGRITLNGRSVLLGRLWCDQLSINSGTRLEDGFVE